MTWSPHSVDGVRMCFKDVGAHQFDQAASACTSAGGKLLSPRNANELADLRNIIKSFGKDAVWLDGSDAEAGSDDEADENWKTSTGFKVPFLDWNDNEPNGGQDENCLEFGADSLMNDKFCSHVGNVICQKPTFIGK